MIIRWRNGQGEQCSTMIDGPIEVTADTYREDARPGEVGMPHIVPSARLDELIRENDRVFPIKLTPDEMSEIVAALKELRGIRGLKELRPLRKARGLKVRAPGETVAGWAWSLFRPRVITVFED
jgi:hypothetical protein